MKRSLLAVALLAVLVSGTAYADDNGSDSDASGTNAPATSNGWTGTGELGYASAHGNTRSENINAKLGLSQENEYWKNNFFLDGLRSKGQTTVTAPDGASITKLSTTANRYDTGASVGYKLDQRSYIVTAARYAHDDFGADVWQGIVSVGYGYIALKNERTELSFEAGPGFKEYQPADTTVTVDGVSKPYHQGRQSEAVLRGLVNYKYRLTDNTALEETFLTESGSKDKYFQNDLGVSVSMTKKLSLKVAYEIRHHSSVLPGIRRNDTLTTTNLAYNF